MESILNLENFQKKDDPDRLFIFENTDSEKGGQTIVWTFQTIDKIDFWKATEQTAIKTVGIWMKAPLAYLLITM